MLDFFAVPSFVPGLQARMALALIFTAAAAYFDLFNKKWVPNALVYAFAALAVLVNFIYYDPLLTWQALAIGAVVFGACYLLYKVGQLGGADAYVIASIAATVPYLPSSLLNPAQSAPYPFILSVLAPTGVAFILHMVLRFVPYVAKQVAAGKIKFTASKVAGPIGLAAAFLVFVYAIISLPFPFPPVYIGMLIFLAVGLIFFTLFKSEIKDSMIEQVKVGRLQEEDVLALEKMDPGAVQKMKLQPVLTLQSIALLKKSKQKLVPVYTGMPFFLPYLLFGLVFSLLFGDMLLIAIH